MKFTSFLIFTAFFLLSITCENKGADSNKLLWSNNNKLTWSDFKGKPDKDSEYKAMTYVKVDFDMKINENSFEFSIPCYFIKNLSWSKSKRRKSLRLLQHEQLHFDIAELHARKIRKALSKHKYETGEKTTFFLDSIANQYYDIELFEMNTRYDMETEHGTIDDQQKRWEEKIKEELKSLRKYSNKPIKLKY